MAEAVESLLTRSLTVPGNPEGYALFREGPILATLSANPRAAWATQTYGLTGSPPSPPPGPSGASWTSTKRTACRRVSGSCLPVSAPSKRTC
jgi:hypothetical protein